jgi:4-amino-4-deoxy-L-arabinose transferase
MSSRTKPLHAIIFLGFLLAYILPIGYRPLIIPDETRYAEIPREMIATGDWIVPRLNGVRYFEKPVMGYWLNGLAMLVFGENPFAARFPSAMAAGLSALMVWLLMRRSGGGPASGLIAALIFLTTFEVVGTGVFSVLDGPLSMFITMAMTAFYLASNAPRGSGKEKGLLALFGMCCGMAFLTKGFLAFAVPVVVIVPYMIWEKRWKDLFRMAGIPIVAATLIALPWAIAVHLKEPDFWNYFFWVEHVKRFMAEDAQHKAPFWFYFLMFPLAALPWSFMVPAAVRGMDRSMMQTALFRYALCWFSAPLLFFSAASGKLITYILPCFPPFALLLTYGLTAYFGKGHRKAFRAGAVTLSVFLLAALVGLIIMQTTGIGGLVPYSAEWKVFAIATAMLLLVVVLLHSLKKETLADKIGSISLAVFLFLTIAQFALPDKLIAHKAPGELLLRNASRVQADTCLVSFNSTVRAVCWFYKRSDVLVLRGGEMAYGFSYPEARHRLLDLKQLKALIEENKGKVVLISKFEKYQYLKTQLPPPIYEDHTGPDGFAFAQY